MPFLVAEPKARNPLPLDFSCEHGATTVPPKSRCLMGDIQATFAQQVSDIAKGQRKTDAGHEGQWVYLGRTFANSVGVGIPHYLRVSSHPSSLHHRIESRRGEVKVRILLNGRNDHSEALSNYCCEPYLGTLRPRVVAFVDDLTSMVN